MATCYEKYVFRVCWYILQKNGSETTCIISGSIGDDLMWKEKDWYIVPGIYSFRGKQHVDRLITVFAKLKARGNFKPTFLKATTLYKTHYILCCNDSCNISEDA